MFRLKLFHFAVLALFSLQLADLPAIIADAATSKLRICPHTKLQYKRGMPCPCGHRHGKNRNVPHFVGEHGDCGSDADDDRLHTPGFEGLIFTYASEGLLAREIKVTAPRSVFFLPSGLTADPPDIPS